MVEKLFVDPASLLLDSYRLAGKVFDSEFHPNFLVGLWRGGTPVGIAVQEFLEYKGIETDHIAARTSAYDGINKMGKHIRVHGLDYLIKRINAEDRLLLVDDVYDTGLTMQEVVRTIERRARKNTPTIKIATVYYKPTKNKTDRIPDFYVHETDQWLVFPHELSGLTEDEIRSGKGEDIARLLKG